MELIKLGKVVAIIRKIRRVESEVVVELKAVWSKSVRESFDQTLIVSLYYVEQNTITPISAAQLGLMKTIDDNENYQIFYRWLLPGFI